jgi:hypothetical protein
MHARLHEHARTAGSMEPHPAESVLLDELDHTMAQVLKPFTDESKLPWFYQYDLFQRDRYRLTDSNGCQDNFESLAVQFGLLLYIGVKVRDDRPNGRGKARKQGLESQAQLLEAPLTINKSGRPLLHCAVDSLLWDKLSVLSPPGSLLVPTLLHLGARPNDTFDGRTVWHHFLAGLHRIEPGLSTAAQGEKRYNLAKIVKDFIEFGADLNSLHIDTGLTPQQLIWHIVKHTPIVLREIEKLIEEVEVSQELTATITHSDPKATRLKKIEQRFRHMFYRKSRF